MKYMYKYSISYLYDSINIKNKGYKIEFINSTNIKESIEKLGKKLEKVINR